MREDWDCSRDELRAEAAAGAGDEKPALEHAHLVQLAHQLALSPMGVLLRERAGLAPPNQWAKRVYEHAEALVDEGKKRVTAAAAPSTTTEGSP